MSIWQDQNGGLHDDDGGAALSLPNWPQGATMLTEAQVQALQAPTLDQVKAQQIAALQAAYKSAINAPVSFKNAAGVTSTYPAGDSVSLNGKTASRNLSDCLTPGAAAWTMGKWLDSNNVAQDFTFSDLQGLAAAMEAVEVVDWQELVAKVAAVQAATTEADVLAVTF